MRLLQRARKSNGFWNEKGIHFHGPEPRNTLYSSLITHFWQFRKRLENQCRKGCQKACFLVPGLPRRAPWAIDSAFWDVAEKSREEEAHRRRKSEFPKIPKSAFGRQERGRKCQMKEMPSHRASRAHRTCRVSCRIYSLRSRKRHLQHG